ncbi:MAG: alpha/beta hydrolase [Candidatus Hydrogenedentota bacterium]
MKALRVLLLGSAVSLLSSFANAEDVTVTDWRGETVVATEGSVDSGGVKIFFHSAGEGPLVVFVHSIFGPWSDFRHQIVMLSERYRVVAMSTRGTDKSDKPVGHEHYATAKISGDIAAIIDHFGEEKAVIVGQDSGGLHAWHFAMTRPERTRALISLGSVHPTGLIRELTNNEQQQQSSGFQKMMQENPEGGKRMITGFLSRPGDADEPAELAELRKKAFEGMYPESIIGFYMANWPMSPVTMETEGFGFKFGEFPPVKAPTLFMYGKKNGVFLGGNLNDMWDWVEGPLTIQVLPGVGHGPHTEAPEIVTPSIMRWLDGIDAN